MNFSKDHYSAFLKDKNINEDLIDDYSQKALESSKNRYSTYFITANDLITQLKKAQLENTLSRRLKHFTFYSVLIIDEV